MWWLEETVPNFKGFNISSLSTDKAWINISSSVQQPLWLYILSDDCYTCSFQKFLNEPILQNHSYKAIVNTKHGLTFRFRTFGEFNYTPSINDSLGLCDVRSNLGEFGVYSIYILHDNENDAKASVQCSLKTDLEPVNIYLPILATLVFWLCVGVILKYCLRHSNFVLSTLKNIYLKILIFRTSNSSQREDESLITTCRDGESEESQEPEKDTKNVTSSEKIVRKRKKKTVVNALRETETTVQDADETNTPSSSSRSITTDPRIPVISGTRKERLKSLDALRGICIIIMMFADDGGGGYYFLQHSTWDGLYVADLAFPWFIWICGAGIPFAMHSRISSGASKQKIFQEVLIRSLKLVLLGIMVNTSTRASAIPLEFLRVPGVLQRFGIRSYFIGSTLLMLFCDATSMRSYYDEHEAWKQCLRDFKNTIIPWCIVIMCIGVHTVITFLLPVPDCPIGYVGPAGLHNDSALPPQCVGGSAGYIDRLIFGTSHIHNRPTFKKVYGSGAYDPEGLLGVLTSVMHIWLGIQAGLTILTSKNVRHSVIRMLTLSITCGIGGFVLCGGISNSGWIPVNKNLWSLSFVLITSSAAFTILVMLYLVIDVQRKWNGSALMETGRNSILLYLGHEVFHAMLPWHFSYSRMITHTSKLMETYWGIVLWIIIAVYLHDRQIYYVV